ncbi:hypothetical protein LZC95_50115 [Pendulispora brunnea]|uniref:Uncharacterized protein n=1 Tax=Pendulispora brunnea TaxID=2905690 RepID=A0ABZ2K7A0_9BACT
MPAVSLDGCEDLDEDGFAGLIADAINAYVDQAKDAPDTNVSNTSETFPTLPYATSAHLRVRIGNAEFLVAVSQVDARK